MRTRNHIIVSAGVSAGLQTTIHSWPATAACFFSGFLIDVDHYLDYFIIRKKFPYRYNDLYDFCMYSKQSKVYLFLHAYEFLLALWLSICFFHLGKVWLGVAIGVTIHLVFDQFINPIKPLFYFLTYRIMNKFDTKRTLSEAYFQRKSKDSAL